MPVQFNLEPPSQESAPPAANDAPPGRAGSNKPPGTAARSKGRRPSYEGPGTRTGAAFEAVTGVAEMAAGFASAAVAVVTDDQPVGGVGMTRRGSGKVQGVFFKPHQQGDDFRTTGARAHHTEFRHHLDSLLTPEEYGRAVGRELHRRLGGDMRGLPALQRAIAEKWGFPDRVFPLLRTKLQRAGGSTESQYIVEERAFVQAFVGWLQVLRTRADRTKVSRKQHIVKHSDANIAKVYSMGEALGRGTFGEVNLAEHSTLGVKRVIKTIAKAKLSSIGEEIEAEVDTLRSLDHPHIIRIFESFDTESSLLIVMDYAEGGDLSHAIEVARAEETLLPEPWSRLVAEQIALALEYMHSKLVLHCDLKPGNTMLLQRFDLAEAVAGRAQPHVLVADFGLAELCEGDHSGSQLKGSPLYLAPEGFNRELSQYSDMWALGVIIYEMLLGDRPFKADKIVTLHIQIEKHEPSMENLTSCARELVAALMRKEPQQRPSAKECLGFKWFAGSSSDKKLRREGRAEDIKGSIRGLGHQRYFHRATMFCIAAGMGMTELQKVLELFRDIDESNTGYLSMEDIRCCLRSFDVARDPKKLMVTLDLDQDGQVSYTEFVAGALRLSDLDPKRCDRLLRYAFEVFDLDGDGGLDMTELSLMLSGAEGHLADVLPDGSTVEQVMEEITGGEGPISFADFEAYLKSEPDCAPDASDAPPEHLLMQAAVDAQSADSPPEARATALVAELLGGIGGDTSSCGDWVREEAGEEFPDFHEWFNGLYRDAQAGASTSRFLRFANAEQEAKYVEHYLPHTCQQICLLALALVAYSTWSLFFEDYTWDPSLGIWDSAPRVSNNAAWITLFLSGVGVVTICLLRLRRKDLFSRVPAQTFECWICVWACLVPFVSCFFANRHRSSAMFGYDALDIFPAINSDYDLIVVMLGALTFFSTRTNLRFVLIVMIAMASIVAYVLSSALFDTPYTDCGTERNWAWPAVLLTSVAVLGLLGHRSVEMRQRLTFLSLEASYRVLKDIRDDFDKAGDKAEATTETRTARLKRALDLVQRLKGSADATSPPLRAALSSLETVMAVTLADVVHADRLLKVDVREELDKAGIGGTAMDLLLNLLEEPPRNFHEPRATTPTAHKAEAAKLLQPWGWDVLPPPLGLPSSTSSSPSRPLAGAPSDLLLQTAVAAGAPHPDEARLAAGRFLEEILAAYAEAQSPASEARAALAVLSAHWLARNIGLWEALPPWDRFAFLAAAVGLHCEVKGGAGGALLGAEPLLSPALSATRMLAALERSGLCESCADVKRTALRFASRARPRCALDDARRLRIALDGEDPCAGDDRPALCGLVLAAADLAFLALPSSLRARWVDLCCAEVREGALGCVLGDSEPMVDVAAWLRGLIDSVALPVYDTLAKLDAPLLDPVRNLRANTKHWKETPRELPAGTASLRGSATGFGRSSGDRSAAESSATSLPRWATATAAAPVPPEVHDHEPSEFGGTLMQATFLDCPAPDGAATLLRAEYAALDGGTLAPVRTEYAALDGATLAPGATLPGTTLGAGMLGTLTDGLSATLQSAEPRDQDARFTGHSSPSDAEEEEEVCGRREGQQWPPSQLPGQVADADPEASA